MSEDVDHDRDVNYLRDVQYRDSSQLAKRANLHVNYRTARVAAFDFFASFIDWPAGGAVLDVGAGSGHLWEHVAALAPDGIRLTVSDLSPGMVDEAVERARATGRYASVEGRVCDARVLPFADESFDVVTSTYALYHVPTPEQAVAELARVLSEGGTLGVMTNGPGHLAEIERIRVEVFGPAGRIEVNRAFSPAIAASTLVGRFDSVAWHRYEDRLLVPNEEDVLAFMTSTPPASNATPEQLAQIRRLIHTAMNDGVFVVSKDTGAFVCKHPRLQLRGEI